ncbi:hypothetical protein NC652_004335 [Populus alba x Populus x berolinensis]|nr:hypothetical protein NC652_004335 [Populus alba x Populus x berolinensis]
MVHAQQNGFLQILESVHLDDCGDIRAPFPAKLLQALKNLKSVEIEDCKSLEEVFELGEADEGSSEEKELPLLSSLTELQLSKLPELKCIWKGPTGHVSLQSLAYLSLNYLNKLTFIFTPSLAQSLSKLESLRISECGELKHIIREEDGEREIIPESPCFPKLKSLFIYRCGKLEYVFPVSVSPSLLNLEKMQISDVDNLKQIFYSGEGDALPTDGIIKFPRLRSLSLSNCSFFGPRNFAAQLPSLQYLNINGHKELGNLCAQLQGLTNLETLSLKSLPDMRCIWKGLVLSKLTTLEMAAPGEQNGSLQRLECVQVNECGDVTAKFLQINLKTLKEVIVDSCESLEELFELGECGEGSSEEKELLSSLTELQLSKLPELKCIWKGPTGHVSLQSLVVLKLYSLDKLTFIFTTSLAQSLPKLERLSISRCGELKHIIREEDGEREIITESPCFPQLKEIFIEGCDKLETLEIQHCGELKHIIREEDGEREIIPESPRFPKLETLIIEDCGKLEYVFPVSVSLTLQSLPQLERLDIRDCGELKIDGADNLKQILYSGEGDALPTDGIIKFPRLRYLSLSNCRFFGPKNFAAQLPSLQYLKIDGHKELGNLSAQLQGLTNLKALCLKSLPDMRCIWKGVVLSKLTTLEMAAHGQQNDFLQRLESVHVVDCGDVCAPFPTKLLQALKNLKSVEIKDCKSLEEVFELGEADEGSSEEKELPLLSSLTALRLSKLPQLKCILKGPTGHVSLQSLARLYLQSLDKLTFIFTPSLAQSLPKLERLEIRDCGELKHIIREEDGEREIIPICENDQILLGDHLQSLCFPNLYQIEIRECNKLKSLFPVAMASGLPKLQTLKVSEASQLLRVFGQDDHASPVNVEKEMVLPYLWELSLEQLSSIVCFSFGSCDFLFPRLGKLKVHQCPKLSTKFATTRDGSMSAQSEVSEVAEDSSINREWTRNNGWKEDGDSCECGEGSSEEKELLSSLTELQLSKLPELKCIWKGPTGHVSLQSLVVLKLYSLDKLTFIFTTSLAQSLPKLERLSISRCGELKHIIREEDGEREIIQEDGIIKFPQLRKLSLQLRSNYSFLSPMNFDAQLPLQKLTIEGHEEVGNWLAQLQMVHAQQNGFLQILESVHLDDCGDIRAPFPAKLLQALKNLKSVEIEDCKSLEEVFELGEADEEVSLTKLQLKRLPELKCIWKGPTRHVILQNLAYLSLNYLNKLTFIFTPSLAQSLPKLESLCIRNCGELKHIIREGDGEREIIPESPRFPKLKEIFIQGCGKLEYVFPVSVSPSLLNLEKMQISDVDNLKQIFYSGEGDALPTDFIIKFPRLRSLSLSNCSFFGPRNFAAQLPSLQYLNINGHKELGNLCAQLQGLTNLEQNDFLQRLESVYLYVCGDVRAPFPAKLLQALKNLKRVEIEDSKSLEEVFELGEADEGSSEEKELPLLSSLTELQLSKLPELKCIWKGPTGHVSLRSLARLFLDSLDKLAFIFTPSLAQSLPKLESLRISDCGELKHIIREEDGEREIIPESPGQDDQASPVNVEKEVVLPNLKELSLEQLSSIVCFSFGWCDYFLFPRLEKLKVHQCPKLTTKFATTPNGSMSAQSEVSEVAEDSSINREWTRNNGWKEDGDSCL